MFDPDLPKKMRATGISLVESLSLLEQIRDACSGYSEEELRLKKRLNEYNFTLGFKLMREEELKKVHWWQWKVKKDLKKKILDSERELLEFDDIRILSKEW